LERIDSAAIHYEMRQRAQRLGTIRTLTDTPPESRIPANDLERAAYDSAEIRAAPPNYLSHYLRVFEHWLTLFQHQQSQ
jgi:hypothetical protein